MSTHAYQALTAMIIESGDEPAQQFMTPLPAVATSLIEEHVTGVKAMLQPFVIAVPMQDLPVVPMVPTLVASQYTSHEPWHTEVSVYVPIPTCPTQAVVPPHVICCPIAWKLRPFDWLNDAVSWMQGFPVFQHPVVVNDDTVLNGCRVPDGTQPATHVPLLQ